MELSRNGWNRKQDLDRPLIRHNPLSSQLGAATMSAFDRYLNSVKQVIAYEMSQNKQIPYAIPLKG